METTQTKKITTPSELREYLQGIAGEPYWLLKANNMIRSFNKRSEDFEVVFNMHEDGPDTWRYGWSEEDYRPEGDSELIFAFSRLEVRSKGDAFRPFQRASTYTAEVVYFFWLVKG